MSQASKTIKLEADVSMDPFDEDILLFDVHEHILQYLNGSDLLKASEVSRCWNEKVESAKGFIEKIKLRITAVPPPEGIVTRSKSRKNELTRHDIAAVLESRRNYVNVDIRFQLLNGFNLREELMQKFAASIKYMTCDNYIDRETPDVCFPNLIQLEMIDRGWRFRSRSFEILLPLMPAVKTLRVDMFYSEDRPYVRRYSSSLSEVRCKRLIQTAMFLPLALPQHNGQAVNHNIRLIIE